MDTTTAVYDTADRYLAPADVVLQARPAGPWDANAPLVRVCAWCPDAAEQTASARAAGRDITHGICPACVVRCEAEWTA